MPDQSSPPIFTKMVLCGGGIKGWAEHGSLMALNDHNVLKDIDTVAGTSVGGLTAGMLALGKNIDYLSDFLKNLTPSMLQDPTRKTWHISKIDPSKRDMLRNFRKNGSFMKGDKLYEICQMMVFDTLAHPNATFKDLHDEMQKQINAGDHEKAARLRNLIVTATVKNDHRGGDYQIVLSNDTTPNMPIALALRMTSSFPLGFAPVVISEKSLVEYQVGATKPLVQYSRKNIKRIKGKGITYNDDMQAIKRATRGKTGSIAGQVKGSRGILQIDDGGVAGDAANLPTYLFADNSKEVIGLNLADKSEIAALASLKSEYSSLKKEDPIEDLNIRRSLAKKFRNRNNVTLRDVYVKGIRQAFSPPGEVMIEMLANGQIASPDTLGIKAMDFGITNAQKSKLLENGYAAALEVLQEHNLEQKNATKSTLSPAIDLNIKTIVLDKTLLAEGNVLAFMQANKGTFKIESRNLGIVAVNVTELNKLKESKNYIASGIPKKFLSIIAEELARDPEKDVRRHESEILLENTSSFMNKIKHGSKTEENINLIELKKLSKMAMMYNDRIVRNKGVVNKIQSTLRHSLSWYAAGDGKTNKEQAVINKLINIKQNVSKNFTEIHATREALRLAIRESAKDFTIAENTLYKRVITSKVAEESCKKFMPDTYAKFELIINLRKNMSEANALLDFVSDTKKEKHRKFVLVKKLASLDRRAGMAMATPVKVDIPVPPSGNKATSSTPVSPAPVLMNKEKSGSRITSFITKKIGNFKNFKKSTGKNAATEKVSKITKK